MGKTSRYDTSSLIEDQQEPGSRGRVLKNLLGIKTKREMGKIESRELLRTMEWMAEKYDAEHRFSADDICSMHRVWLGNIYEWAGRYRNVTMSKGGFLFASPAFIPRLMADFEREILHRYTPCHADSRNELVEALAVVHTELLLIHPSGRETAGLPGNWPFSWHYRPECRRWTWQSSRGNANKLTLPL